MTLKELKDIALSKKIMRFNLHTLSAVAIATSLVAVGSLHAQSGGENFRLKQPMTVTNQDGQTVKILGMQGSAITFQLSGGAGEASIPITRSSNINFTYPYPNNFSDIQFNVLNGNYEKALLEIRKPPTDLLRFLSIPEKNCNFHLYGEIYYRALVYAGDAKKAVAATNVIPWNSKNLPVVFVQHAATLLNRMVSEEKIDASESILAALRKGLSVEQYSEVALPVADKLRALGRNDMVESIYSALAKSSDPDIRKLGEIWGAYNLANTGKTEQAKQELKQIGEIGQDRKFFPVYCLAQGRLALSEKNSVQALRFLSRAMVRTTIVDSYKPELYFLMIQSYMLDKNQVPATRLAKEMAIFYPNNMWMKNINEIFPEIGKSN